MRRRVFYVLLFAVPALLAAVVVAAMVTVTAAGVFWIFIFGDDPWPAFADSSLTALFAAVTAGVFGGASWVAYTVGRREEARPTLKRSHVALALGITVALGVLIASRTMGIRVTAPTDSERCMNLCLAAGHSASGMPPRDSGDRTCSCYDSNGREALRTPISTP